MRGADRGSGSPWGLGCGWDCQKAGAHTLVWGDCAEAPEPPCAHPGFVWDDGMDLIRCTGCLEPVGLMELVEKAVQAGPGLFLGCSCWGDEEEPAHTPDCGSRPIAWRLDPVRVRDFVRAMPAALRQDPLIGVLLYGGAAVRRAGWLI